MYNLIKRRTTYWILIDASSQQYVHSDDTMDRIEIYRTRAAAIQALQKVGALLSGLEIRRIQLFMSARKSVYKE